MKNVIQKITVLTILTALCAMQSAYGMMMNQLSTTWAKVFKNNVSLKELGVLSAGIVTGYTIAKSLFDDNENLQEKQETIEQNNSVEEMLVKQLDGNEISDDLKKELVSVWSSVYTESDIPKGCSSMENWFQLKLTYRSKLSAYGTLNGKVVAFMLICSTSDRYFNKYKKDVVEIISNSEKYAKQLLESLKNAEALKNRDVTINNWSSHIIDDKNLFKIYRFFIGATQY